MVVVFKRHFAALLIATALLAPVGAAQADNQPAPQISVINLQVVKNERGSQSVITPKGDLAALPGAGVDGAVAQIYFGSQGGFWYTDRTGQTIDLSPTVQELQARRAQQIPQYAPVSDTSYQNNGGSAIATAAAAAGGAALGSAMSHGYYNAPYGTPMYYGNHGNPYYYNNGERREIEELNQNQKMAVHNKRTLEDQQKQEALSQRQSNKQASQENRQAQFSGGQQAHEQNFQKQQDWYQNQLKENSGKWKKHDQNPFASNEFSRDSFSKGERAGRETRQSGERSVGAERGRSAGGGRHGGGGGGRGGGGRGGGGRRGR
jgi:uncharacterized membrane protein YgcG